MKMSVAKVENPEVDHGLPEPQDFIFHHFCVSLPIPVYLHGISFPFFTWNFLNAQVGTIVKSFTKETNEINRRIIVQIKFTQVTNKDRKKLN